MAEYIRFITCGLDSLSNRPQGVFQTLFELRDEGKMDSHHAKSFNKIATWFDNNLKKPTRFAKSRKPRAHSSGICWYKSDAHEHINKMYELVEILKEYLVEVQVIKSSKPGYIVYDDEYQIVAEPFAETQGTKLKK